MKRTYSTSIHGATLAGTLRQTSIPKIIETDLRNVSTVPCKYHNQDLRLRKCLAQRTYHFNSVQGKSVTLSSERLGHILQRHPEIMHVKTDIIRLIKETVEDPEYIVLGKHYEHMAIRFSDELGKHIVIPYDGGRRDQDSVNNFQGRQTTFEEANNMEALVEDPEKLDIFYDKKADVLYISFGKKPKEADDSELTDNDIIVRRAKGKIVGLTVLSFSKRIGSATS